MIVEAQGDIVQLLTGAGIRATTDQRDLNPPCVLVTAPEITWRFGKGGWDARWLILAVVPDSGPNIVLANLDALVVSVQAALGGRVQNGRPVAARGLVDGSAPLPAYELTWTARIP